MRLVRAETITDSNMTSSVAETEAAWASGTTYASGAVVRRTVDGVHRRFTSVQNSNTGHDPATDATGTWWTDEGPTNRWNMFDQAIQTQTTDTDSIEISVELAATSRADTVAVLNVSATAAQVTVEDPVEGVVYDESFSLVSPSGITDWYAYFYEPIARVRDLVITDVPPYAGATVTVALTESGATVACGALVVGFSKRLGDTQYGAQVGIIDYSRKSADDFGNYVITERAYAKKASFPVMVPRGAVDEVANLLADFRATPALYIGSDQYGATAIWGFYRDWSTVIAYPDRSLLSIELEGLS